MQLQLSLVELELLDGGLVLPYEGLVLLDLDHEVLHIGFIVAFLNCLLEGCSFSLKESDLCVEDTVVSFQHAFVVKSTRL